MRRILAGIVCLACVAGTTQPATEKSPQSAAPTQPGGGGNPMLAGAAKLPLISAKSVAELVRLRMNGDVLIASCPIYDGKDSDHRVQIDGRVGEGELKLNASRFPGLCYFRFDYFDYSNPHVGEEHIGLGSSWILLGIDYNVDTPEKSTTVSLDESADPGADAPVVLRVQVIPEGEGSGKIVREKYLGNGLSDLRRKYPAEYERYLRPAMREFGQEEVVFGVEDKMGWQVVSDTWSPPAGLGEKVDELVGQLNSDDYSTRAAAQKGLKQIGEPAALYLLATQRSGLSPEQTERLDQFLAPYHPLDGATLARLRKDRDFLIDMLYSDDRDLRAAALDHLRRLTGKDPRFDLGLTGDARVAAVAELRRRITPGAGN